MFKRLLFVFGFFSLILNFSYLQSAIAEDITITTYYPSPHGSYDELGANKLAVDVDGVAVPTEYAAMAKGDAHIGRSLIIGAGAGSGYAFDEGATTADGTLLVKGKAGIGTTNPRTTLEVSGGYIEASNSAKTVRSGISASNGNYLSIEAFNSNNTAKYPVNINPWGGNVGIGTTIPWRTLHVNGSAMIASGSWTGKLDLGTSGGNYIQSDVNGLHFGIWTVGPQDGIVLRNGSGNVGIGLNVPNPGSQLDVRGITQVTDDWAVPDTSSYASFGVTRAAGAVNRSYIGLTKQSSFPWGIGIDSGVSLIFGQASPGRTIPSPAVLFSTAGMVYATGGVKAASGVPGGAGNVANVGFTFSSGDGDTGMFRYGGINGATGADLVFGIDSYSRMVLVPAGNPVAWFNGSTGSTGAWFISDLRWKKNIKALNSPIDKLLQLRGVSYEWKTRDEYEYKGMYKDFFPPQGRQIGMISQEVEKQFPELVLTGKEGYKSIAYENFIPILLEAIKAQQAEIKELKARLDKTEAAFKK